MALRERQYVEARLQWLGEQGIWPNGLRYLWTDAFGLVLYVSLYAETGDAAWLRRAEELVGEVYRVLGRRRGLRIGEEADRDGQYFHYLAMWIFALTCLGRYRPEYRDTALDLVRQVHPRFVVPGLGVIWKMEEDLSGPYPGYGLGAMDAYDGYVSYRLLDADRLAGEIADLAQLIEDGYRDLVIDQDLGLGMMLWLCHWFPEQDWARLQQRRSVRGLDGLWVEPPGYFCRQTGWRAMKFAFTNYGIALGLQAQDLWPRRVALLHAFFEDYRSGDEYDRNAITHVMGCSAHFPGLLIRGEA